MTTQYDLIVIGTELDISSIEELSNLGAPWMRRSDGGS